MRPLIHNTGLNYTLHTLIYTLKYDNARRIFIVYNPTVYQYFFFCFENCFWGWVITWAASTSCSMFRRTRRALNQLRTKKAQTGLTKKNAEKFSKEGREEEGAGGYGAPRRDKRTKSSESSPNGRADSQSLTSRSWPRITQRAGRQRQADLW